MVWNERKCGGFLVRQNPANPYKEKVNIYVLAKKKKKTNRPPNAATGGPRGKDKGELVKEKKLNMGGNNWNIRQGGGGAHVEREGKELRKSRLVNSPEGTRKRKRRCLG